MAVQGAAQQTCLVWHCLQLLASSPCLPEAWAVKRGCWLCPASQAAAAVQGEALSGHSHERCLPSLHIYLLWLERVPRRHSALLPPLQQPLAKSSASWQATLLRGAHSPDPEEAQRINLSAHLLGHNACRPPAMKGRNGHSAQYSL